MKYTPQKITAALFLFLMSEGIAAPQHSVPPEVSFIAAGVSDARNKLQCLQADVSLHMFLEEGNSLPEGVDSTSISHWNYNKPYLSQVIEFDGKDGRMKEAEVRLNVNATEAKSAEIYVAGKPVDQKDNHTWGLITRPEETLSKGFWTKWIDYDPRYYTHYEGIIPLDEKFLRQDFSPKFLGEEEIYGSRCFKIQLSVSPKRRNIYWIDVEHNFLLRRQENYFNRDNEELLAYVTDVLEVKQIGDVWLSTEVKGTSYAWGKLVTNAESKPPAIKQNNGPVVELTLKKHGDYSAWVDQVKEVSITNIRSDCPTNYSVPQMNWPLGTSINVKEPRERLIVIMLDAKELNLIQESRAENRQTAPDSRVLSSEELATVNTERKIKSKPILEQAFAVVLNSEDYKILLDSRNVR